MPMSIIESPLTRCTYVASALRIRWSLRSMRLRVWSPAGEAKPAGTFQPHTSNQTFLSVTSTGCGVESTADFMQPNILYICPAFQVHEGPQVLGAAITLSSGMCDQVISSAALAGSALSQVSCSSGAMITGVRFSSPGLWNWFITGCSSALTVSMEKDTTNSPEDGSVHRSHRQA